MPKGKGRYYAPKMAKKMNPQGYYEGQEARSRQEYADSMMIREDRTKIANLPQEVIMKEYPKTDVLRTPYLDDTIRGIDAQIDQDVMDAKRQRFPEKY